VIVAWAAAELVGGAGPGSCARISLPVRLAACFALFFVLSSVLLLTLLLLFTSGPLSLHACGRAAVVPLPLPHTSLHSLFSPDPPLSSLRRNTFNHKQDKSCGTTLPP